MTIRLLVVDEHPVVHVGLDQVFQNSPIQVIGHATTAEDGLRLAGQLQPDVLLLDVKLPDRGGLDILGEMRQLSEAMRLIMYSGHENTTYVARAIALGADEYLLKSMPTDQLVPAISYIVDGGEPASDSLFHQVRTSMRRRRDQSAEHLPLTNREMQVLRHVAMGLSNREVAQSLDISVETVKEHVQNILRKLDVNDRTQAAVWAVKRSLV